MNTIPNANTSQEYDAVVAQCKDIFFKKNKDYGSAWRILRPTSITDQIFIKAKRIKTLEETQTSRVAESEISEYIGIVNYCLIAMMQLEFDENASLEIDATELELKYNALVEETKNLMFAKNHDYGEAWREMRISSLTDLILMKLLRVKQIEDNKGETVVSEGVKANYQDMINYSVFALIKLS